MRHHSSGRGSAPARKRAKKAAKRSKIGHSSGSSRRTKPGKRNNRRGRSHRRGDTVNVGCARCEYRFEMKRVDFRRESRRAARCRCPLCGGNVVLAKYVDVVEKKS